MSGILWAVLTSTPAISPRFSEGSPHHVTLIFGGEKSQYQQYLGREIEIYVTRECWNDRIQALSVVLPGDIPCQNSHPHITVSFLPGVNPVESNTMLEGVRQTRWLNFKLKAIIEWHEWK